MAAEARQESYRVLSTTDGARPTVRRADGFAHDRPLGQMPVEIGFLAAQGLPPNILLKAASKARDLAVSADRALLGAGFPEDTFYRLLARHLGMPYLDAPLRLVLPTAAGPWNEESQIVGLAPNARGLERVLAPRGAELRLLLETYQPGQARGQRTAIVSPRCLKALIRRQRAPALLHLASHGLASWDPTLSARDGLTSSQEAILLGGAMTLALGLIVAPGVVRDVVVSLASLLFAISVWFRLAATAVSPKPDEPAVAETRIPDHRLPIFTIIVPLLREAGMVPQLVAALAALDYPAAKLDVKILLEEGDHATIAAIEAQRLPFDTIMAPRGFPRTKPRALNIGLAYARGDFLVVYDAEDRPDPGQLRAAVARFAARPRRTACLQARLAIDNVDENWLTRLFAMEYAGLFDVMLPGLAALRLPIPLGGTSNHFRVDILRRVNGWDAFNVTEDMDLGFRLARFGYAVEALDSTTFEEAPVTLADWLPQRTRWLKGWMVTLMVLTRQPCRLMRELGFWRGLSVIGAFSGTILGCLFGPVLFVVALTEMMGGSWFAPNSTGEALVRAGSIFLMVWGAISAAWPIALGLKRRGRLDLLPHLVTLPVHFVLLTLAAWRALYEAAREPQRWNKTEHRSAGTRAELPTLS